jgi:opacity protein-like surface antigen
MKKFLIASFLTAGLATQVLAAQVPTQHFAAATYRKEELI